MTTWISGHENTNDRRGTIQPYSNRFQHIFLQRKCKKAKLWKIYQNLYRKPEGTFCCRQLYIFTCTQLTYLLVPNSRVFFE